MTPIRLEDSIRTIPDFPKPGIMFRDITTLLASPEAFRESIRLMKEKVADLEIEAIAAAEARGFLFGAPLALELNLPVIPIRKPGKLPAETISYSYDLEYGSDTLEMHADAFPQGTKVLIVDDLLATGGTVEACCRLVEKAGGEVVACLFVIELLGLGGAEKIGKDRTISLVRYIEG
jgi:adenine phosphoribosyltransferase